MSNPTTVDYTPLLECEKCGWTGTGFEAQQDGNNEPICPNDQTDLFERDGEMVPA